MVLLTKNLILSVACSLALISCDQEGTIATGSSTKATSTDVNDVGTDWELVWHDDFNDPILDSDNWITITGRGHDGHGNKEAQSYEKENIAIDAGNLIITAKQVADGQQDGWWCTPHCNYTSGKIQTSGKQSWRYGKFEARIKMPVGSAIWPAFWMLPENDDWPSGGEIDIVEVMGRNEETTTSAIHWGPAWNNRSSESGTRDMGVSLNSDFFIYGMTWDEKSIIVTINGTTVKSYKTTGDMSDPFGSGNSKKWYFILNFALGGSFDCSTTNSVVGGDSDWSYCFGWPDDDWEQAQMIVDWVRVSQKK